MSSSYPKHNSIHRLFSVVTAMLIIGSFLVIIFKDCRVLALTQTEFKSHDLPLTHNFTVMVEFINRYYDFLQIRHIVITIISVALFLLGFINIAPKQEDLRFGFHLIILIIMVLSTVLTLYSSYTAFHKPCHAEKAIDKLFKGVNVKSTDLQSIKDMKFYCVSVFDGPVNAYIDYDISMLAVTAMDALAGVFVLISTALLCADARNEAIRDEYKARVRLSVY